MTELDFSKIRTIDGSQDAGFEELICQLAHLQKPDKGLSFIRKEGAGGDAGAECFWILEDGNEHCWQAKYFLGEMSTSRWKQIDKSFKAALKKHKNLKKFVVCLPLDRTDSRKAGKGGKQVISVLDEWNKQVSKWNETAKLEDKNIEFEYWGKHEIRTFLTIDNPLYNGRALYWFSEPILNSKIFDKILTRSQSSLGERYTPKFHVDLPIARKFDGLCLNPIWWETLYIEFEKLVKQKDQIVAKINEGSAAFLDKELINEFFALLSDFMFSCHNSIRGKYFLALIDDIKRKCSLIRSFEEKIESHPEFKDEDKDTERLSMVVRSFFYQLRQFQLYLDNDVIKAAGKRAAVIWGEAGIGKSHLLCDLAIYRMNQKLPTIFLLGQHYQGGNPINFLAESLDLKDQSYQSILGAMDAAGEAQQTQTLIIIDAINEGPSRDDWFNHIQNFLTDVSFFKNVSVLLSCRTTYLQYLIPKETLEENLVKFEHIGFRGFEHRAAAQYLSKQSIVLPSAPILAPEFTNPLFLKTCCKALKANKMTTFPKGLHGFTSLFDFYIESIEKVIARKKQYRTSEQIIKHALVQFASSFFPKNLEGLQFPEARNIINKYDPQPYKGDSLFDELMHENILSEDISYKHSDERGIPVVRFTYERFSDYFIANKISDLCTKENIHDIFSSSHEIGKILSSGYYHSYRGILEALSIVIAEKFKLELADVLPREKDGIRKWALDEIFAETIIWRSPESITPRSLELLNELKGYSSYSDSLIDILLKVSTEPSHPWNANFLHKNLSNKKLPDRDAFWSTHLALNDQAEADGSSESIVRIIIDWACFGKLDDVDKERKELCAITLFWFLTTPNRRVRDHATKSLVRLLHLQPDLLPKLIEKFHDIDDYYLLERLYAVAYGVVCNLDNKEIITTIATRVYSLVFENQTPIPHILLRDYARGILEYATYIGVLPNKINPDTFRPPYKSEWPIKNPDQQELDILSGDMYSSGIKSSLMGFPGDFGNYTLSCIHDWSPTILSVAKPETGADLKKQFAKKLKGEIKKRFLASIKVEKKVVPQLGKGKVKIDFVFSTIPDETLQAILDKERKEREDLLKSISDSLPTEKEYFRWLSGLDDNRPATFSKKWAQRWICIRAYELGWSEDKFKTFESLCSHGRDSSRPSHMERMGKKYQWIALHELLARLSDNVHWIDRGYSDLEDLSYYGPWQMHKRDVDPTLWIRQKNSPNASYYDEDTTWWQTYKFPINGLDSLDEKIDYLWSKKNLPDFSKHLLIHHKEYNQDWTVLRGFWNQHEKEGDDKNAPKLDCWFRINSIIIKSSDFDRLKKALRNKTLRDPDIARANSTQHQGFLKEYPWHPYYINMQDHYIPDKRFKPTIPIEYFRPVSQYEWESGSYDYSLNNSLSFYIPSKTFVNAFQLRNSSDDLGLWQDKNEQAVFIDPSVANAGPSYALINTSILQKWLLENDMKLVWLIGGEKQLFTSYGDSFFGRLVYSGIYSLEENQATGNLWFMKETV